MVSHADKSIFSNSALRYMMGKTSNFTCADPNTNLGGPK